MHNFDIDEYMKLSSIPDKIAYLDNSVEKEITLNNLDWKAHGVIHSCFSNDLHLAMARKRMTFNNYSILNSICITAGRNINIIISALEIYEANRWFQTDEEVKVIETIFSYKDSCFPRDDTIYNYIIDLYLRLGIPINKTLENILNINQFTLKNVLKLLNIYKIHDIPIDKNVFIKCLCNTYYSYDQDELEELIYFCITNNLNIYNVDNIVKHIYLNNREHVPITNTLSMILSTNNSWKNLKKLIDYYIQYNYSIQGSNMEDNILKYFGTYNLEAIEWIITYYKENNLTEHILPTLEDKNFIYDIISENSIEVLIYILNLGVNIENISNYIYRHYVPCKNCSNGERHPCNYRNITLEFILLFRYGIKLQDLHNKDILDKLENQDSFNIDYYNFNERANENIIYNEPQSSENN